MVAVFPIFVGFLKYALITVVGEVFFKLLIFAGASIISSVLLEKLVGLEMDLPWLAPVHFVTQLQALFAHLPNPEVFWWLNSFIPFIQALVMIVNFYISKFIFDWLQTAFGAHD